MKRLIGVLIVVCIALSGLGAAVALGTDDQGNPNDPTGNDRANACYDGSTMEGKCGTEWAWVCGWYIIRYDAGIYTREEVPATCRILLPDLVEEAPPVKTLTWPPAGCYYSAIYSLYIFWDGNQTQPPPINMTWDGSCATPPHTGVGGFFLVSTADPTSAAAMCTSLGYNYIDEISSAADTGAWPIYRCQIP